MEHLFSPLEKRARRGGREFLIHPSKPNFVSEFHSETSFQEENKAVGKSRKNQFK
jgi:hypothetical protein